MKRALFGQKILHRNNGKIERRFESGGIKKCHVCKTKNADVNESNKYYCASCWLKVFAKNVRPILNLKSHKKS